MHEIQFLAALLRESIERNWLGIFRLRPEAEIRSGFGWSPIRRIFTVVFLVVLLVTTAASAAPLLELSPSSGRAGDSVTVIGSSFNVFGIEFAQATIRFNGDIVKSNVWFNGSGFTTSFIVPSNIAPGTYTVQATGPLDSAEATFTVKDIDETVLHGMSIYDGKLPGSGHSWTGVFRKACEDEPFDLSFKLDSIGGGFNCNINMLQNKRYAIGFINLYNGSLSVYLFKEYEDKTKDLLLEKLFLFDLSMYPELDSYNNSYDPSVDRKFPATGTEHPVTETELWVRIAYDQGHIQVYISRPDQEFVRPVIDYYDEDPLPQGNIDFETLEGSSAHLSEVVNSCSLPTEESSSLGVAYFKEPDISYLIDANSEAGDTFSVKWGEVPSNQILVLIDDALSFEDARDLASQLAERLKAVTGQNASVVGEFEYINLFQIETESRNFQDLIRDISIARAFSDQIIDAFPNEQIYPESPDLNVNPLYSDSTIGGGYNIIGVQDAWNAIANSKIKLSKVNVGIVDDGVYLQDGQFAKANINTSIKIYPISSPLNKLDMRKASPLDVAGSHGTGVANILAADTNGRGLQGIASILSKDLFGIYMINVSGKGKSFVTSSMLAFQFEIQNGSSIISCSMGKTGYVSAGASKMYDKFFSDLSKDPRFDDVIFIFSAGNEGETILAGDERIPNGLPDSVELPNVITVGNIMNNREIANGQKIGTGADEWEASKSNINPDDREYVTLAAPGEQAFWGWNKSQGNKGIMNRRGGTSMAAPQVTAAAILIRSIDPCLNAYEIKDRLTGTASIGPKELGGRILDIDGAVNETIQLKSAESCEPFRRGFEIILPGNFNTFDAVWGNIDIPKTDHEEDGKDPLNLVSFTFSPNPVCAGETSTMRWNTTGAIGVMITPGIGIAEPSGFRILTPKESMGYTIHAWNETTNTKKITKLLELVHCIVPGATSTGETANVVFDFIKEARDNGQWQGGRRDTIFRFGERSEDDERGSAIWKDNFLLSDMRVADRVLQVRPPENGYITGTYRYMDYTVHEDDRLSGGIGFANGSYATNATFSVYLIEGNVDRLLFQKTLLYNEGTIFFDEPLKDYAGWQPAIILKVDSNGPSYHDTAAWLDVKITGSSQRPAMQRPAMKVGGMTIADEGTIPESIFDNWNPGRTLDQPEGSNVDWLRS